ncbi:MAG: hypothetical protein CMH30_01605 [Micavibrio sp.]|nr:hypothetical protein [Micavibrio sp.]|tara:strand:- start:600 stop:1058 length:459 start_codon:yes stop_codon:yes gene_type:complete
MLIKPINGQDASNLCKEIIVALPEWFGVDDCNQKYINGVASTECFAGFINNKAVALIAIRYHFDQCAEIWWLGSQPAFHGSGVGSALLQEAESAAVQKGFKYMLVHTLDIGSGDSAYEKTYRFYQKNGYRAFLGPHMEDRKDYTLIYMMKTF